MWIAAVTTALARIAAVRAPYKPIIISCVGDSVTSNGAADHPNMTYPAQLQRLLGEKYFVINNGVSGTTMMAKGMCGYGPSDMPCLALSRMPNCSGNCAYRNTSRYRNATTCTPDIVTIMMGTNDAKGQNWNGVETNGLPVGAGTQFAADYRTMIAMFKALPSKPKVYVVLPPPAISQCPSTGIRGNASICLAYNISFDAVNVQYPVLQRMIANDAGADGFIDVWTALGGLNISVNATADGIHPKDAALGVIAKTIASVIAGG